MRLARANNCPFFSWWYVPAMARSRFLGWSNVVIWLARHDLMVDGLRPRLLRLAGHDVASDVGMLAGVRIGGEPGEGRLTIGSGSWLNQACFFDCSADVVVGQRVWMAYGVRIVTSTHDPSDKHQRAGARKMAPVRIGDGSWLGTGATVLGGVTIGEGVIVAAGAVVTKDCESNSLYAGVPARKIKDLS